MKPFDPRHTPLTGTHLIEASAGTGKTYAIEGLFVRLLLELALSVEQILVVTFTKAATAELKARIRAKLISVQAACAQGAGSDLLPAELITTQKSKERAQHLLQSALINFDQASIFTIHGFCQRILHEHTFETGSLFDTELLTEQSDLLREIADDFWRTHFYAAEAKVVQYALDRLKGPEYFFELIKRLPVADIKIVPPVAKPILRPSLRFYREAFAQLQTAWPASRPSVSEALKNPALKGNIYGSTRTGGSGGPSSARDLKVMSLLAEMDQLVNSPGFSATIFKGFDKFTTTKIEQSAKSGQPAPRLQFFDLCDNLAQKSSALIAGLETHLLYLKVEFFRYAARELGARKKASNVQFYDDLLLKVRNALADTGSNALAAAICRKYKAALVDEFQDTDPVQYEIFSRLFGSAGHALFMIGDPKQAVYGFRGADIFTYMQASRAAPRKYTLMENWRSDAGLIRAVNTIFGRVSLPFVFKDIPFAKVTSGREKNTRTEASGPAMTIWYVKGLEDKPLPKMNAEELVGAQVAAEIVRLLNTGTESVTAGELAVLVRTNRQALLMKTYLSRVRVPAVLYNAGNIFESHEAMELERVLACIAEPYNERRLRAALVTDMMGVGAAMIHQADRQPQEWEPRRLRILEYFQLWEKQGVMRMICQLLIREKIRTRLLSFPDGERRLTNILHLAELLQQESVENKRRMTALITWLAEQRNFSGSGEETHQLRLESDAGAVKIVTIHKSKGLEYPVVFCPFLWDGSIPRNEELFFHDPADERLTLDLSPEKDARHLQLSRNELLAENIRLLYVAVTRAKKKCYLAWGRIHTAETAAMAYLFHHDAGGPADDIIAALQKSIPNKKDAELIHDLKLLADSSGGSIAVVDLPAGPVESLQPVRAAAAGRLQGRKFTGRIDRDWRVCSYSTLISQVVPTETFPDRDASDRATGDRRLQDDAPREELNIFAFPKGSHAGNFFHDIFENLDFTNSDDTYCSRLVESKLQAYGISLKWKETVCRTIRQVVATPLSGRGGDFSLSLIQNQDRLNELEFYFPLKPISARKLKRILSDRSVAAVPEQPPELLEKLIFAPAKGFMKGFMDLVFRFQGWFYLVDWKSNFLGPAIQDYRPAALRRVMQAELYFLQYRIYTLALHQYLRQRVSDYCYEKNFGGIFYIFLRGVDPEQGPECGIFRDTLPADSVAALAKALIPQGD